MKVLYFFTEPVRVDYATLWGTLSNQTEFNPILTHLIAPHFINYTESQWNSVYKKLNNNSSSWIQNFIDIPYNLICGKVSLFITQKGCYTKLCTTKQFQDAILHIHLLIIHTIHNQGFYFSLDITNYFKK